MFENQPRFNLFCDSPIVNSFAREELEQNTGCCEQNQNTKSADWLNEKKINIVVQYTPERHPELPGVPALVELGRTDEDKQVLALYGSTAIIGRSFTTAPDVPGDKIAMLRSAFDAMVRDTSFLSEIEKGKLEFEPLSGVELQAIIAKARNVSEAVKERARRARGF